MKKLLIFVLLTVVHTTYSNAREVYEPIKSGYIQEGTTSFNESLIYLRMATNFRGEGYLAFRITDTTTVESVVLRLYVMKVLSNDPATIAFSAGKGNLTEGLTWDTRPNPASLKQLGNTEVSSSDPYIELDITDYYNELVTRGNVDTFTIRVAPTGHNDLVQFYSVSSDQANKHPLLSLSGRQQLLTPVAESKSFYPFPHFTWTAHRQAFQSVSEPVYYEIEIARDKNFQNVVDRDSIGLNRYIHDRPLEPGNYFWRVRALPANSKPTEWSSTGYFAITPCDEEVHVNYNPGAEDHFDVVQQALSQAKAITATGKSVRVVFPKGTYKFDKPNTALITLSNTGNMIIDGNGSMIHSLRYNGGLSQLTNVDSMVITGFEVDFPGEKTFLQGRVLAVNKEDGTVTVKLEQGFPGYDEPYVQQGIHFMSLLDTEINGRLKSGASSFFQFESYSAGPDGTWILKLIQAPRTLIKDFAPGDRFVHLMRNNGKALAQSNDCQNITYTDITSYGASAFHYASYGGSILNILHCQWKIAEGNWFSGNADGIHCRGLEVGPWVEACSIQAIGDDGIALYARPATVYQVHPGGKKNALLLNDLHMGLEPGNQVSFFNPDEGKILFEGSVSSVQKEGDVWLVLFAKDVPDGIATTGEKKQHNEDIHTARRPGWISRITTKDIQRVTQIWNRSKSSGDFMIRNNSIRNIRRYGTVFRARRGVVEGNFYEGTSSSGVIFMNEPYWPNGLYCSDIIIHDNEFRDCSFQRPSTPPVTMRFQKFGDQSSPDLGPRRVLIKKNRFQCTMNADILLVSAQDFVISGNTIVGKGSDCTRDQIQIDQQNTRNVIVPQ